jgi:uncharacterized protein YbaR (Trm112 family)
MAYEAPPELLAILADPETKGPVRLATAGELARLKEAVGAGRARRHDGKAAEASFEAAFVSQQGAVAYVVEEGIPVFLVDERLDLDPSLDLDAPITPPSAG